jgi:EAL domain-containing protein (putative c-di-GMP-specific phosphodiesterase class I)
MIARSTIELAHTLGLATVAEGVETMDTLDVLQGMQCDTAQGYLISRPLPEQEFLDFLASSEWAKHTRSRNRAEHL